MWYAETRLVRIDFHPSPLRTFFELVYAGPRAHQRRIRIPEPPSVRTPPVPEKSQLLVNMIVTVIQKLAERDSPSRLRLPRRRHQPPPRLLRLRVPSLHIRRLAQRLKRLVRKNRLPFLFLLLYSHLFNLTPYAGTPPNPSHAPKPSAA